MPLDLAPGAQSALAIVVFMAIYWVMEPVDHAVTALMGCYLFWLVGAANFSLAFSGFASSTPWFLFGALLMGEAASRVGLSKRVGYFFLNKSAVSYPGLLFGIIALSFVLCFFIPSGIARVTAIAPILIGIIIALGLNRNSYAAKGLFVALTYSASLFDLMMMSGPTSILTRGILEEQSGASLLWSQWLVAFLPVTLLTILACWLTVLWLFPAQRGDWDRGVGLTSELRLQKPPSSEEKKAIAWLIVAILLWSTDFLHHTSPALIGIGLGLALFLPKIGALPNDAIKRVNLTPIIFSAGALSVGNVLMQTRALDHITLLLRSWIEPAIASSFQSTFVLYWSGVLYHFVIGNRQAMIATSLPALVNLAQTEGFNPVALGLIWTFSGGGALFVYQSAIFVAGYSYGYFSCKDLAKVGALMTLIQGIFLMLLVPLYWPLIGLSWMK